MVCWTSIRACTNQQLVWSGTSMYDIELGCTELGRGRKIENREGGEGEGEAHGEGEEGGRERE